jgi:hypothetical protein
LEHVATLHRDVADAMRSLTLWRMVAPLAPSVPAYADGSRETEQTAGQMVVC